ncbi:hypothetical protein [Exiguobacterium artemiae]|uniref:hypothetical protein n=1 Tax=Exiguobacterium artemiae TaxID=340145 RepID=UPI002963D95F|nr:hypothetical protein [Exiguobacterium sibiricum]MDW2886436.1 hypothetical protein [Exiguobacterium sibiricum]
MEQTLTEAQALILEMEDNFKPYMIVGVKQRLDMEEIVSTFECIFKHGSWIALSIGLFPSSALNSLFYSRNISSKQKQQHRFFF